MDYGLLDISSDLVLDFCQFCSFMNSKNLCSLVLAHPSNRAAFAKMCDSRIEAAEMRCTWQLAVRRGGYENRIQQTIENPGRLVTSAVAANVGCRTLRSATC